jgi:uncharacterized protein YjbI with pentapeptide repeats
MKLPACLTVLARAAICSALLLTDAAASICFSIPKKEFLERPALIFEGIIQGQETRGDYRLTHYRINVLYKGVVDGDTVDIGYRCTFEDDCSTDSKVSSESRLIRAVYSEPSTESPAPFTVYDCMNSLGNDELSTYLPDLDRYRVALVNAYRRGESQPRALEPWDTVTTLQLQNHDYLGALDTLRTLRRLAPDRQKYVVQTGDSFLGLGRFPEALAQYQAALELGPAGDDVRAGKFRVFAATDRFPQIDADWRDFSDMDLTRVSFAGRNLTAAQFRGAKLHNIDFAQADLTGADFSDSSASASTFTGAVLRNAKLRRAQLSSLSLAKGDFAGADMTGAALYGAQLPGADLRRVDLTDANLQEADLSGADLKGARFLRTRMIDANLSETDLSGADLRRIELQGAILRNTKLVGANLTGAYLAGLPVEQRGPSNVGRWKPADLRGADLTNAILLGADMRQALYDCTTKFPSGFSPRGLTEVESEQCAR